VRRGAVEIDDGTHDRGRLRCFDLAQARCWVRIVEEGCGVGEALPMLYLDTPNKSCMHGDGGLGIDLVAS
jgi:hypothetical protein